MSMRSFRRPQLSCFFVEVKGPSIDMAMSSWANPRPDLGLFVSAALAGDVYKPKQTNIKQNISNPTQNTMRHLKIA